MRVENFNAVGLLGARGRDSECVPNFTHMLLLHSHLVLGGESYPPIIGLIILY